MAGMFSYTKAAMERAMKIQEVILRAMAKKVTWYQAAEINGISDRHMRRWRERYEEFGYDGLFDRRRRKPSPKRVVLAVVEQVLGLYRDHYRPVSRDFAKCPNRTTMELGWTSGGSVTQLLFQPLPLFELLQMRLDTSARLGESHTMKQCGHLQQVIRGPIKVLEFAIPFNAHAFMVLLWTNTMS